MCCGLSDPNVRRRCRVPRADRTCDAVGRDAAAIDGASTCRRELGATQRARAARSSRVSRNPPLVRAPMKVGLPVVRLAWESLPDRRPHERGAADHDPARSPGARARTSGRDRIRSDGRPPALREDRNGLPAGHGIHPIGSRGARDARDARRARVHRFARSRAGEVEDGRKRRGNAARQGCPPSRRRAGALRASAFERIASRGARQAPRRPPKASLSANVAAQPPPLPIKSAAVPELRGRDDALPASPAGGALAFEAELELEGNSASTWRGRNLGRRPRREGHLFDRLLAEARAKNASDLHIVATRPSLFRVAGELVPVGPPIDAGEAEEILLATIPPRLRRRSIATVPATSRWRTRSTAASASTSRASARVSRRRCA